METFGPPREFVENPGFEEARLKALAGLKRAEIDRPIANLISQFAMLPHCFTLQSCHGHFVCGPNDLPDNNDLIPDGYVGDIRYRIAYIALCIENSERGRALRNALSSVARIDAEYVQFGSAWWFWDQWVNSYVLQVEPAAHQFKDVALLQADEARYVERVRDLFFEQLRALVACANECSS